MASSAILKREKSTKPTPLDPGHISHRRARAGSRPRGAHHEPVRLVCFEPAQGGSRRDAAGHLLLRPVDYQAVAQRRYLPRSLVLETTWTGFSGTVIVLDALALGPDERGHGVGRASPGVLLRRARCVSGSMRMRVEWASSAGVWADSSTA